MVATINQFPADPTGTNELWGGAVAEFIASKDPTLTRVTWWSPCDSWASLDKGASASTGTASLVPVAGTGALKLRSASGVTAGGNTIVRNFNPPSSGGANNNLAANCRTSHWALACKVIVNSVTASSDQCILGMSDEATQTTELGVLGATSQVNFSLKIGSAAAQDTGVPIGTLGTTEHLLVVWCDGTTVRVFYNLDPTEVASGPSNTGANAAGHWLCFSSNGAVAADAAFDLLGVAAFGP